VMSSSCAARDIQLWMVLVEITLQNFGDPSLFIAIWTEGFASFFWMIR